MSDWASSGRVKIERAKEHVENLKAEILLFNKRDPYVVIPDVDKETGEVVVRVELREAPPLRLGAITGDAVHNLRSALNVLWRTVWPSTSTAENRKDDFPIYESSDLFKTRFGRIQHGVRKPIVEILKALKPYKGGNDLLWMLRVINDTDKHHVLIPVFTNFGGGFLTMTPDGEAAVALSMTPAKPVFPIEENTELLRFRKPTRMDKQVHVKMQIAILIAFGEPEIVKGQPIVDVLNKLAGVVDGVVETFSIAGLLG